MDNPDSRPGVRAVLFDRDGTLVHDVPYNGDPEQVHLVDGAVAAVERVRAAGVLTGIVTNQSGVGRGLITAEQADAVTAEVVRRLGGVDVVRTCPHAPGEGCGCRKPAPGLVLSAAEALSLQPGDVAVVGDSSTDAEAARAAGARSVLVPGPATPGPEPDGDHAQLRDHAHAPDLAAALDLLLAPTAAR